MELQINHVIKCAWPIFCFIHVNLLFKWKYVSIKKIWQQKNESISFVSDQSAKVWHQNLFMNSVWNQCEYLSLSVICHWSSIFVVISFRILYFNEIMWHQLCVSTYLHIRLLGITKKLFNCLPKAFAQVFNPTSTVMLPKHSWCSTWSMRKDNNEKNCKLRKDCSLTKDIRPFFGD